MDQIDIAVVQFLNSLAWQSALFDYIVTVIMQMNTFQTLPLICVMIWLWFSEDPVGNRRRSVFNGFLGALAALLMARGMQALTPYKPRPALNETLNFVLPAGAYPNYGSSFPSDTAGLAFALVLAIWLASKRWGTAALLWALLVVCFPRLYSGFHYLSDIIAGSLIGLAGTYVFVQFPTITAPMYNALLRLSLHHAPWFFVLSFVIAYQTTNYYLDIRKAAGHVLFKMGLKEYPLQQIKK